MKFKIVLLAALLLTSVVVFADDKPLYTVADGNKVDANTLAGWKTWRAMACERCHGAQQQGLVGPSLIEGLKKLTKEQFKETVLNGRPGTVMPPFKESKMVNDNIDNLYAYLKGRSDGAIKPGHLLPIESK
ncbi:MAG TPA: cytochrome c [Burkholderiales bacterium]|nr:cytochrome c [Burkholderiales bacterium]